MIEEQGCVVAVEPGAVWVETARRSACSACSARSGCGQGVMDRLGVRERRGLVRAQCDQVVTVGDAVVIGVDERALVKGSLFIYLLPLLGLLIAALAAQALGLTEPAVIASGLLGFALCWALISKTSAQVSRAACIEPVVLRVLLASHAGLN